MSKRILFMLLMGVLLVSACTTATPEPTDVPTEVAESTEIIETEVSFEGDQMLCATVFDYEIDEETARYQAVVDQLPAVSEDDWISGNPDAPITIVEYADFQCSACAPFAMQMDYFMNLFPDSIRIVFRHLPLASIHDKAYISSMAAEAAGAQGKFWEMYFVLYENQQTWSVMTVEEFQEWAKTQAETLELDVAQFEADLLDEEKRAALEANTEELLTMGAHYTPFVILNDRIYRQGKPDLFSLVGIHYFDGFDSCPPWVIEPDGSYTARMDTSAGEIMIDLLVKEAPLAVNSFVFLAKNGWFDDVSFHRVIEGFVAQAGDPSGFGVIGPGYTFANETDNDLSFDRVGILGMANAGPDTNGSQFFITLGPTTDLDGGYTIFGVVQEGSLFVLDEIALRNPEASPSLEGATIINSIEIIKN